MLRSTTSSTSRWYKTFASIPPRRHLSQQPTGGSSSAPQKSASAPAGSPKGPQYATNTSSSSSSAKWPLQIIISYLLIGTAVSMECNRNLSSEKYVNDKFPMLLTVTKPIREVLSMAGVSKPLKSALLVAAAPTASLQKTPSSSTPIYTPTTTTTASVEVKDGSTTLMDKYIEFKQILIDNKKDNQTNKTTNSNSTTNTNNNSNNNDQIVQAASNTQAQKKSDEAAEFLNGATLMDKYVEFKRILLDEKKGGVAKAAAIGTKGDGAREQSKSSQIASAIVDTKLSSSASSSSSPTVAPVVDKSNISAGGVLLPTVTSEAKIGKMNSLAAVSMMDELSSRSSILRKELESSLLGDLQDLDENALRLRAMQLTAEFMERTKWEGVRIHEAVKQVEDELSRKYKDLMINQRAELELEASKIFIKNQQKYLDDVLEMNQQNMLKYEAKLEAALRAHSASLQNTLDEDVANNARDITLAHKKERHDMLKEMSDLHDAALKSNEATIERVRTKFTEISKYVDSMFKSDQMSASLHRESSSFIALENAFLYLMPLNKFVDELKQNSAGDDLTLAALNTIPSHALQYCAYSIPYLQNRFSIVREEVRKVALAPDVLPPIVGHVVGNAIASLSWAPNGLVQGDGPEEILARAAYHLDQGRVQDALSELNSIQGYGKVLLKDWETIANERLIVEQALKIIRANQILKHRKMA